MKKNDVLALGLILAAYLALALAYGVVVPPFEGLDEAEHFGAVRYVADAGRLPVQGDAALVPYHVRQEASQPPLYYLFGGPLLRWTSISAADVGDYLAPNPYVTCGNDTIRANKATLRHDLFAEAFPWHGTLLAVHLLRVLSTMLQAFTVVGVYAIARRVFPDRPGVPALAAALTAFNPQFLIVAGAVNNDNIATPVITWALYGTMLVIQDGPTLRRTLVLGVLIGLAALSKLTGLLLVPMAAIAVAVYAQREHQWQRALTWVCLSAVGLVPFVVSGWWYIYNLRLYGDWTGLAPMLDIVGRRGAVPLGLMLSELGIVFRSYWGQFPCAFFDSTLYYSAWALIVVLGLIGAVLGLRRQDRTSRTWIACLALWLALVLVGWLRWNLTTPAPGGRLLFAAVGATSTLLAYGLTCLLPPRSLRSTLYAYCGSVVMAGVGLLALLAWVRPLFAPPPLVDAALVRPQVRLQAQFGESIDLLGYDLSAAALGPGRFVDVAFYWRAHERTYRDFTLALQLAALAPGDTRTLLNFNTWPGGGNLPTSAWPVGPVIVDRYRVPLPPDTGVTQAWRLQALWYDAQAGARLPLALNAQPGGEALTLDTFRVKGTQQVDATLPGASRLPSPVNFSQAIALTHAQVDVHAPAGGLRVRLLWQSLGPLSQDVTVFVHAYNASGKLVATGDGPPLGGNFPTSLWQSGDQVLDEHVLALPDTLSSSDVQVTVGLYRPEDGIRLAATQGTTRLPDDEMVIWPK